MLKTFDYIKCYQNSFWEWDSDEEYVRVKEGVTFAQWQEVLQYLSNLAPMGLPLFDVLLGVMASTANNEFHSTALSIQAQLLPKHMEVEDHATALSIQSQIMSKGKQTELDERLTILDTIAQVDEKYRKGENRFLLIAAVIERVNVKHIDSVSVKVVEELNDPKQDFYGMKGPDGPKHIRKVINCFGSLSFHFKTPESIVEAMIGFNLNKLNLDDILPQNADRTVDKGSLLDELKNEAATKKMADLIPYVMSGLNFPIHASQSDDRPEGGVSDLSNKGHFDQLIVSEFAYDDDYFMSRIVNNEALFYQREKAKNDDDNNVCVLIDASLYMWGLPKLIATAISCSVGLKDEDVDYDCFFVGNEMAYCNFRTIEGILKGTRFANASICPEKGLDAFIEAEKTYSNTLFVTTEDSWRRPEMRRFKVDKKQPFDFLILVNETANIKVHKSNGKKVADFKLDLDAIWKVNIKNLPKKVIEVPNSYPLLFPMNPEQIKYYFKYNEDVYFIDRAKGLFRFKIDLEHSHRVKGATFIRRVESGLEIFGDVGPNVDGEMEVLFFNRTKRKIVIYNLRNNTERKYDFSQWRSRFGTNFYYMSNQFYFVCTEGYWTIDGAFKADSELIPTYGSLLNASRGKEKEVKGIYHLEHHYPIKINSVFLSTQGEIVVKNRRIEVTSDEYFKYYNSPIGSRRHIPVYSRLGAYRTFTFDSGEMIVVNPSGILEFRFKQKNRPLGYELFLTGVSDEHKLSTVSLLKQLTSKGLKECKELADAGVGRVLISSSENQMNKFAFELRKLKNNVDVVHLNLGTVFYMTNILDASIAFASDSFFSGNIKFKDEVRRSQSIISPMEFYELYLKSFIENIQNGA